VEREVNEQCADAAIAGVPFRVHCPDRLVGVGHRVIVFPGGMDDDGRYHPAVVKERGTAYILIDLDDTAPLTLPDSEWRPLIVELVQRLASFARMLDRVEWVIKTSTRGLQVLCRLQHYRRDVRDFYAAPAVKTVLRAAGGVVAALVGSGKVDESVWRAESLCRAPGWRGSMYGAEPARLLYTAEHGFVPWN